MTPQRFRRIREVLNRRQPDLTVVTDYVHKGQNLSAIVRTADAVGIMEVHSVIGDEDYRAFRGTAKGSHRWVRVVRRPTLPATLQPLREAGYQVVAAHMDETAVDFREIDYTRPTALVLGAEKDGLSADGWVLADRFITIPMMGMVRSFNVSVAAGIVLSEAQRQRQRAGLYDRVRLDEETYRTLLFQWAHPKLRHFCDRHGLPYPPLNEEGEVADAPQWYRRVREELGESPLSMS